MLNPHYARPGIKAHCSGSIDTWTALPYETALALLRAGKVARIRRHGWPPNAFLVLGAPKAVSGLFGLGDVHVPVMFFMAARGRQAAELHEIAPHLPPPVKLCECPDCGIYRRRARIKRIAAGQPADPPQSLWPLSDYLETDWRSE